MQFFSVDDIPKECKDNKTKAKYVRKQIEKACKKLDGAEKTATEIQCKIGSMFVVLKGVLNKKKHVWPEYIKDKFPYINIRTVQRYMKLAKSYDSESSKTLAVAGQTRLLSLANKAKQEEQDVGDFLEDKKIDLDFDSEDPTAVSEFREKIDEVLNKKKPAKKDKTLDQFVSKLTSAADVCFKELESAKKDDKKQFKHLKADSVDESIDMLKKVLKQLEKVRQSI
jgi:hypothetical protein